MPFVAPPPGLIVDQAFLGSPHSRRDSFHAAVRAGVEWVSVTEEAVGITEESVEALAADARETGVDVAVLNCHAFGLSDPRDVVREFNVDRVRHHVDLAARLGTARLKLLLGEWVWRGMWPDAAQWSVLVASLGGLAEHARARGVLLEIEMEPLATALVADLATLDRLVHDVGSEIVTANVDVSHMVVRGLAPSDVARLATPIGSVDFSDSNGAYHEHLCPGRGVANLAAYAEELMLAGSGDTLLAVEIGPLLRPDGVEEAVAEAVRQTSLLFAAAPVASHG